MACVPHWGAKRGIRRPRRGSARRPRQPVQLPAVGAGQALADLALRTAADSADRRCCLGAAPVDAALMAVVRDGLHWGAGVLAFRPMPVSAASLPAGHQNFTKLPWRVAAT